MNQTAIPRALRKGWHQILRTEAWYRCKRHWLAIITSDERGYQIVLRHTARTFEDALAAANDTLNQRYE